MRHLPIAAAVLLGLAWPARTQDEPKAPAWKRFETKKLEAERAKSKRAYLEFLRVPDLSTGLYVLKKGAEDRQSPHAKDEVYYVVSGKARFKAGKEECAVKPGTILYVRKGVEHRFLAIEEDLTVLVFFAGR